MMTRRDKLLNRPWQLRRYNNHRKKVLSALPAIDFGPPAERLHVTHKLKKLQWEGERRRKIEEDNFKLLQRMGAIMKKNRLENFWETPPPGFLHRVGIYHRTRSPTPFEELEESSLEIPEPTKHKGCAACTPSETTSPIVPEVRVPWAPPKPRLSRRSSSTTAVVRSDFDLSYAKSQISCAKPRISTESSKELPKLPSAKRSKSVTKPRARNESNSESQLIVTQGTLKLAVNFPPYAEVEVVSGGLKKYIQRGKCTCSAINTKNE